MTNQHEEEKKIVEAADSENPRQQKPFELDHYISLSEVELNIDFNVESD